MSYGRRKIFTDATEITAANVIEEVNAAYLLHSDNRNKIAELYAKVYFMDSTIYINPQKIFFANFQKKRTISTLTPKNSKTGKFQKTNKKHGLYLSCEQLL